MNDTHALPNDDDDNGGDASLPYQQQQQRAQIILPLPRNLFMEDFEGFDFLVAEPIRLEVEKEDPRLLFLRQANSFLSPEDHDTQNYAVQDLPFGCFHPRQPFCQHFDNYVASEPNIRIPIPIYPNGRRPVPRATTMITAFNAITTTTSSTAGVVHKFATPETPQSISYHIQNTRNTTKQFPMKEKQNHQYGKKMQFCNAERQGGLFNPKEPSGPPKQIWTSWSLG